MNCLQLFPITTTIEKNSLTIAGHDLAALAKDHGTPLYLYDRETMDTAVVGYKSRACFGLPGRWFYYLCREGFFENLAIAQWTQLHNLFVDCTGEGEIAIAVAGGVPREHILVHGVNKSAADLASAMKYAGTIVVDNLTELHTLEFQQLAVEFAEANFCTPDLASPFTRRCCLKRTTRTRRQVSTTASLA